MCTWLSLAMLVSGGAAPAAGPGALQPSEVPVSWNLTFDFYDIQRIELTLPGQTQPRIFWYMLYTVQNDTGQDVDFYPSFELVTDTAKVYPSDVSVSPLVFQAIKRRHRATHPFLLDSVQIVGKLLQGEDNAKEGVAIWPQFDPQANRVTIYVSGLSGETRIVENPAYDPTRPETELLKLPDGPRIEQTVNPRYFVLRKTLAIRYSLPGDRATRRLTQAQRGIRWRPIRIRGWIGLDCRDLTRSELAELAGSHLGGAKVVKVATDSPAGAAGIKPGDVIVTILRPGAAGTERTHIDPVRDAYAFQTAVWQLEPGTYVTLGILRAGKPELVKTVVGEEPADLQEIRRRGLWVMR